MIQVFELICHALEALFCRLIPPTELQHVGNGEVFAILVVGRIVQLRDLKQGVFEAYRMECGEKVRVT